MSSDVFKEDKVIKISLGVLYTAIAIVIALTAWGVRLEVVQANTQKESESQSESFKEILKEMKDINTRLSTIEGILKKEL